MKKEEKPSGFSRRNFLKGVGSGVAGAYLISTQTKAITEKLPKKIKDYSEGKQELSVIVNGKKIKKMIKPNTTLVDFLRDDIELTGTKIVCNQGECGGCTVLLNDVAVYSCQMLALDADGKSVTTIEGLMNGEEINHLQKAFIKEDGLQCGFCTPGQIMAAQALLIKNPKPTKEEVVKGMYGNLCRCAAYPNIVNSVIEASKNH